MMEPMAVERRAFFRTAYDLRVHRQELYRRAAPVFGRHGYRDAGLKELAAACGLSIPGLYRYFPSKRDLALYPLSEANRPGNGCFISAPDDPIVHLQLWLDHAAWERRDFLLALRFAGELGETGGLSDEHTATFAYHIALLVSLLRGAAPRLGEQRARELVEALLAMSFGAEAIGVHWSPATARVRFVQLLARDLIRCGADRTKLGHTLIDASHPPHGPCSIELASKADSFANRPQRLTPDFART